MITMIIVNLNSFVVKNSDAYRIKKMSWELKKTDLIIMSFFNTFLIIVQSKENQRRWYLLLFIRNFRHYGWI